MAGPRSSVEKFHDLVRERTSAGVSCRSIAREIGINYQSVLDYAHKNGFSVRPPSSKRTNEYIEYNGLKYCWSQQGYWRCTTGNRDNLAHVIYKEYHPEAKFCNGETIHFVNGDKKDFTKENLVMVTRQEQANLYLRGTDEKRLFTKAMGIAGLAAIRIAELNDPSLRERRIRKAQNSFTTEKRKETAKKVWETRRKNAEIKGFYFTPEQRKRMSEAHLGLKRNKTEEK